VVVICIVVSETQQHYNKINVAFQHLFKLLSSFQQSPLVLPERVEYTDLIY